MSNLPVIVLFPSQPNPIFLVFELRVFIGVYR